MGNRENIGWDEALKSRMLARGHANGEGAVDGIDTTKRAYLVAFDDPGNLPRHLLPRPLGEDVVARKLSHR